jgi:hypothetical protein
MDPAAIEAIVPIEIILHLITKRNYSNNELNVTLGDRKVIYQKNFQNISLILFEGTHEMLSDIALELL